MITNGDKKIKFQYSILSLRVSLHDVKYKITPATPDGRGWRKDVKFMRLDVSKLKSLGCKPKMNSREAVARTVKELWFQRDNLRSRKERSITFESPFLSRKFHRAKKEVIASSLL